MRVLILGATGMLGHKCYYEFFNKKKYKTYATVKSIEIKYLRNFFPDKMIENISLGVDAYDIKTVENTISTVNPDVLLNCIGIIKQSKQTENKIPNIVVNALFPHYLYDICSKIKCRVIHIGTDCVFSGKKGMYNENDITDAGDLYGRTKYLGELEDKNSLTIRTSLIGHELKNRISLIDWFLQQNNMISGYKKAIFSGFPTIEFVSIIEKYIIPNNNLQGIYHVSSEPITKYDLLKMVSEIYKKNIRIIPNIDVKIDRSLDSTKFREKTGYKPQCWESLIEKMFIDYKSNKDLYLHKE